MKEMLIAEEDLTSFFVIENSYLIETYINTKNFINLLNYFPVLFLYFYVEKNFFYFIFSILVLDLSHLFFDRHKFKPFSFVILIYALFELVLGISICFITYSFASPLSILLFFSLQNIIFGIFTRISGSFYFILFYYIILLYFYFYFILFCFIFIFVFF